MKLEGLVSGIDGHCVEKVNWNQMGNYVEQVTGEWAKVGEHEEMVEDAQQHECNSIRPVPVAAAGKAEGRLATTGKDTGNVTSVDMGERKGRRLCLGCWVRRGATGMRGGVALVVEPMARDGRQRRRR